MREGGTRGLTAFDCFWKNMKWWIVTTMFVFNRCDNAPYSYSLIKYKKHDTGLSSTGSVAT
jgi:hypothetical protein